MTFSNFINPSMAPGVSSSHFCVWSDLSEMRGEITLWGLWDFWEMAVIGFRLWLLSWGVRQKPWNTSNQPGIRICSRSAIGKHLSVVLIHKIRFTTPLTLYQCLNYLVKAEWLCTRVKIRFRLFVNEPCCSVGTWWGGAAAAARTKHEKTYDSWQNPEWPHWIQCWHTSLSVRD